MKGGLKRGSARETEGGFSSASCCWQEPLGHLRWRRCSGANLLSAAAAAE